MKTKEICQRCGDEGPDLRTLWHSCFYAMEELKIPFDVDKIDGKVYPKVGESSLDTFPGLKVSNFAEEGYPISRPFYSLRVCKDCRADWLQAIKDWFFKRVEKEEGRAIEYEEKQ